MWMTPPCPGDGPSPAEADAGQERALADPGPDATTNKIQGWVKERHGIDMTLGHVSTTRGELRRAEAGKGEAAKKPAAPKPPAGREQTQQSAARTQEQPRAAAEG